MKQFVFKTHNSRHLTVITVSLALLSSCDSDSTSQTERIAATDGKEIVLDYDPHRYTRGLRLYQQHCSGCHGNLAQGATDWQKKNAKGQYPPPPLNGTGHTWHHSRELLVRIINEGTAAQGGNMPAWQGLLNEQQIDDILYWIQSQWDKEIYRAWYDSYH